MVGHNDGPTLTEFRKDRVPRIVIYLLIKKKLFVKIYVSIFWLNGRRGFCTPTEARLTFGRVVPPCTERLHFNTGLHLECFDLSV